MPAKRKLPEFVPGEHASAAASAKLAARRGAAEKTKEPEKKTKPPSKKKGSLPPISKCHFAPTDPEYEREITLVQQKMWFADTTGFREKDWRTKPADASLLHDTRFKHKGENGEPYLKVLNTETGTWMGAGCFQELKLSKMMTQCEKKGPHMVPLEIVTRTDDLSTRFVDVGFLQALPANRHSVFQVASNFNGIEAASDAIDPDRPNFTEIYYMDKTQGPAASMGAPAACITRVHAAFYDPKKPADQWRQTADKQVNFLSDLPKQFPIRNGYVMFDGTEGPIPPGKRTEALGRIKIGYHQDIQVGFAGADGGDVRKFIDHQQVIDQVFCAAVNVAQGKSGAANAAAEGAEDKVKLILDSAYEGTYLAARTHDREKIFLTLIGGGVFGNPKKWIYESIMQAHKKWGWGGEGKGSLRKVLLVLYSPTDFFEELPGMLKEQGIPYRWCEYTKGERTVRDSFKYPFKD